MILSNTTAFDKRFTYFERIELLANAGFDAYDFNMRNLFSEREEDPLLKEAGFTDKLIAFSKEKGISCNQAHAPFPTGYYGDEKYNEEVFPYIVKSIEIAARLGAKSIIIHPIHHVPTGVDAVKLNVGFYKKLLPYAEKENIIICTENMWASSDIKKTIVSDGISTAAELIRICDEVASLSFKICVDVGHSLLIGEHPEEVINAVGKDRLFALHIHDNDARDDQHLTPFFGKLNWDKLLSALAENYSGDFTFEIDNLHHRPKELVQDTLCHLEKTGRYLISELEKKRA